MAAVSSVEPYPPSQQPHSHSHPQPHPLVPPGFLPLSTSHFHHILSQTSHRHHAPSDPPTHTILPSRYPSHPLQELTWSNSQVNLFHNGALVKTYDFSDLDQHVTHALYVQFHVAVPSPLPPSQHNPSSSSSSSSSSLFSPYSTPVTTSWTDDLLPLPRDPPPSAPHSGTPRTTRQPVLLVLLSSLAFAFPLEGQGGRVPIPLPFRVRRAWAIEGGVMLERGREGREVWAREGEGEDGQGEGGLPTLWTLRGTMEEMKPVARVEEEVSWTEEGRVVLSSRGGGKGAERKTVKGFDERVVFASSSTFSDSTSSSSSKSSDPPIIVTASPLRHNNSSIKVSIYTYLSLSPSPSLLSYTAPSLPVHNSPSSPSTAAATAAAKGKQRAATEPPTSNLPSSSPTITRNATLAAHSASGSTAMSRARPSDLSLSGNGSGTKRKHHDSPNSHGASISQALSRSRSHDDRERDRELDRSVRRASGTGLGGPRGSLSLSSHLQQQQHSLYLGLGSGVGGGGGGMGGMGGEQQAELLEALVAGGGGDTSLSGGIGNRSFDASNTTSLLSLSGLLPPGPEASLHHHPSRASRLRAGLSASAGTLLSGVVSGDRRTSLNRTNELSVTMDRMALSQGSNASSLGLGAALGGMGLGGGLMGLVGGEREREWGEMEHEAWGAEGGGTGGAGVGAGEVLLAHLKIEAEAAESWEEGGGTGEAARCEVGIVKIWEGEVEVEGESEGGVEEAYVFPSFSLPLVFSLPPSWPLFSVAFADILSRSFNNLSASLFDLRSPSPPSLSCTLGIQTPSQLLLFSLSTLPVPAPSSSPEKQSYILTATPLRQLSSLNSTAVIATRARYGVKDLLYLPPPPEGRGGRSGGARLITAEGRDLPLSVSNYPSAATAAALEGAIKLEGDGSGKVIVSFAADGRPRRNLISLSPAFEQDDGLGERCLEVIAAVLEVDEFVRLLESVQERVVGGWKGREVGKFEALIEVLDESFGVTRKEATVEEQKMKVEGDEKPWEAFLRLSSSSSTVADPVLSSLRPSPFSLPSSSTAPSVPPSASSTPPSPPSIQLQSILLALHLLIQDLSLSPRPKERREMVQVAKAVKRWVGGAAGLEGWRDWYERFLGVEGAFLSFSLFVALRVLVSNAFLVDQ